MGKRNFYPEPEHATILFREYFLNRTDKLCIHAPWDQPYPVDGEQYLDGLLAAHVAGEDAPKAAVRYAKRNGALAFVKGWFRAGVYTPAPDNTTRWLCFDFDGGGRHAAPLADPRAAAIAVHQSCIDLELPAYIEQSGGGKGWHLWVFFAQPVKAADARALGMTLAPKDLELANGRPASIKAAQGIELFPKQDVHRGKKKFGNQVWLPWWSEAAEGGNIFYRLEQDELIPYLPESFDRVSSEQLSTLLRETEDERNEPTPKKTVKPSAKLYTKERKPTPPIDRSQDSSWSEWRDRALDALPLEKIYGDLLTGICSGDGWLESRDPTSPTGDRTPSAGVADGSGEAERGSFHSFRTGETVSVFDYLIRNKTAADFKESVKLIAEASGISLPESGPANITDDDLACFMDISPTDLTTGKSAGDSKSSSSRRREIRVNYRQLRDIITDAWGAVHHLNKKPSFFLRAGELSTIKKDETGHTHIASMKEAAAFGMLVRVADWVKVTEDAVLDTMPPKDVARDMIEYPDRRLPPLEAVVHSPVFGKQATLISTPGYHKAESLWCEPPAELKLPDIAEQPSSYDLTAARNLLFDELLIDFPFVSEADRTHFIAALILPFVRRMIAGCTPLHVFEAPVPRSGKGLLCDLISIIVTGATSRTTTIVEKEDELRKMLTADLATGRPIILLDNARENRIINSPALASILTTRVWSDRLLGESTMLSLPNNVLWLLTGNNPRLTAELAGRAIRCRIDPKTDRPQLRTDFKHEDIRQWTMVNRGRLVHAVLTIVQAWIAAGKPMGRKKLGSYEAWAKIVGGILEVGGFNNFLGTLAQQYEEADADGSVWRPFVETWWERFNGLPVSIKDLLGMAEDNDLLEGVVDAPSYRGKMTRLGMALNANRDRQFDCYRIKKGPRIAGGRKVSWYLERVKTDADQSPGAAAPAILTSKNAEKSSGADSRGHFQPDLPDLTSKSPQRSGQKNTCDISNSCYPPDPPDLKLGYAHTRAHAHARAHASTDFTKGLEGSKGLLNHDNHEENFTRPSDRPLQGSGKGLEGPIEPKMSGETIDLADLPEEDN